jgi:histidine triad (HIT) family protein
MADDCIFCRIAAGKIPAHVVYQDESACAFLDVNPLVAGHTLLIPAKHYERLEDIPSEEAARYLANLPRIIATVTHVMDAEGATVAWNDGPVAGQEVPHVHAHIVPRHAKDGVGPIHSLFSGRARLPPEETERIADRMSRALRPRLR